MSTHTHEIFRYHSIYILDLLPSYLLHNIFQQWPHLTILVLNQLKHGDRYDYDLGTTGKAPISHFKLKDQRAYLISPPRRGDRDVTC